MKKTFRIQVAVILALIFAFSAFTPAFATKANEQNASADSSKLTEGNFIYKVENGKAVVIGYKGSEKEVTVPDKLGDMTVVAIEGFASSKITSLILPDGIERIGNEKTSLFFGGTLKKINIPKTVTYISYELWLNTPIEEITVSTENKSFSCINGLLFSSGGESLLCCVSSAAVINIPESVKTIGNYAFYGCESETVHLPESLEEIAHGAFMNSNIKSIVIPDSVKLIEKNAFIGSAIESVKIGKGLVDIGEYVFSKTKLSQVTIPANVRSISRNAFSNSALKSVVIENGVCVIDEEAFAANPQLKNIVIPSSVTEIANNAFDIYLGIQQTPTQASRLPDIKFEGSKQQWQELISSNNSLFGANVVYTDAAQLKNEPINMFYKGTTKLTTSIEGEVLWISSDSGVIKVDANGNVTAIGKGDATVQAVSPDGSSEAFDITVSYEWWQWLIIIFLLGFLWYI